MTSLKNLTKRELNRIEAENKMKLRPCIDFIDLRTYEGYEKPSIFCKEDNQNSLMTIDVFPRHYLMKKFNMTLRQYYDKWYKKFDEGICQLCGKETAFFGYNGYAKFCSRKCARKDPEFSNKIKESFKMRDKNAEQVKREKTNELKYDVKMPSQMKDFNDKRKTSCIERFGNTKDFTFDEQQRIAIKVLEDNREYYNKRLSELWTDEKILEVKSKRESTFMERYNVIHPMKIEGVKEKLSLKFDETLLKIRKSNELSGRWIPIEQKSKLEQYYQFVWLETKRHLKTVYEEWNGRDYYTNDILIENEDYKKLFSDKHVNTNPLQPTLDHKVSIKYGFVNNIEPCVIGGYKNLAIVGKGTNSSKGSMIESEFKRMLNE